MSDRYELRITPPARRALEQGPTVKIAMAAREFPDGPLRDNPRRVGHPLRAPSADYWSARRGTCRICYRIDEERRLVLVLDIVGRGDAYDPTRR